MAKTPDNKKYGLKYTTSVAQSVVSSTNIVFVDKIFDLRGNFDGTTYTAHKKMTIRVSARIQTDNLVSAVDQQFGLMVISNLLGTLHHAINYSHAAGNYNRVAILPSTEIELEEGEELTFQFLENIGATTLSGIGIQNWICIREQ